MRKKDYRISGILSIICLSLAFNAGSAFGQCGLPGLPPCPKPKKNPTKKTNPVIKPSDSVNTISPSNAGIFKSGSTFFEKAGDQSLYVSYREKNKDLVFLMEALNHFSSENTGEMHVYVDINGNGKIDVFDVSYKLYRDGDGYNLKANYLSNKDFASDAVVGYSFLRTKIQSRPHPLFSITIPKTEIFYKSGEISVRFEYWSEACAGCVVRIPAYNITGRSNVRDENGLLDFGPVKRMEFTP